MSNQWEFAQSCMAPWAADGSADYDSDGLSNDMEYNLTGTDPCDNDTDNDGMDDGWEEFYSACWVDALVSDPLGNPDGDSYNNLTEYVVGTSPCVPDLPIPP